MKRPSEGPRTSDGQAFLPRKARGARGATNSPAPSSVFRRRTASPAASCRELVPPAALCRDLVPPAASCRELVHRFALACGLQGRFAGKLLLAFVADVAAAHIMVFHAGDALANLGALVFIALHQPPFLA